MKYILIDDCGTDIFMAEFDDLDEAVQVCGRDFDNMTENDKKRRRGFYILESHNPDEEALDHLDGTPVKVWK